MLSATTAEIASSEKVFWMIAMGRPESLRRASVSGVNVASSTTRPSTRAFSRMSYGDRCPGIRGLETVMRSW
ncbi:MAG: hypothetical protein BWY59_00647 [Verrucomicrobia bacterium ADurb.Bin345]|nr:MAG: hypothetical protein BWY59_00647 [Verrucomicrobia bacterium ADurb.Bin345]